ncbi:MAG: hypothetical protein E7675_00785 [Ruminococcaceae bacterium]|nr:hypothetical protein [Oscillospiraceae bacterium]
MKKVILLVLVSALLFLLASCGGLDKSELQAVIDIEVNKEDYTEESYAVYKQKYDEAVAVLADTGTTETKINNATKELNSAINGLVKRANFSVLEGLLAQSYEAEKYTVESYAQYLDAYAAAREVFNNKNSRQSSVNSAIKSLTDKIEALIPKADVSELEQLMIFNVEESKYTASTYNNYILLYNAAQLLIDKANKAESPDEVADCKAEIQLCVTQLRSAIEKLTLRGNTDALSEEYDKASKLYNGTVDGIPSSVYYSEASYKALHEAIVKAREAIESDDMSQKQLDDVKAELILAVNSLEGSDIRKQLYDLVIDTQEKYLAHGDYFTESSYENLNEVINSAIDEYNSSKSTTASLKAAIAAINKAVEELEYVIIIGTGKTDFDFSSYSFRIGNAVIGLKDYFADPEAFVSIVTSADNTAVIEFSGTIDEGLVVKLADTSIVVFKRNSVTIERSETSTPADLVNFAALGALDLMCDEDQVIDAMGANPTKYYVEGSDNVFLYKDALGGYELKINHDMLSKVLTSIEITASVSI